MTHEKVRAPREVQDAFSADPADLLIDGQPVRVAQPHYVPPLDAPTVTVYVRKGSHAKERVISINPIPAGANPIELLNAGFALDGNSATISVDLHTFAYDTDMEEGNIEGIRSLTPGGTLAGEWVISWSLTKAVNSIERLLVSWLTKKMGCNVTFG